MVLQKIKTLIDTKGAKAKTQLLKGFSDDEQFKAVMQIVYNPYIRTNIAHAKLAKADGTNEPVTIEDVLGHFSVTRTGTASDANIAKGFIDTYGTTEELKAIATGIVTKTLKTGVTAKTLNSVYGASFIPLIGIMKGVDYHDNISKVKGPFIATEKIDGIRRLLVKENGKIMLSSRSGIPDYGLVEIEKEAAHLPDNCVYDGELAAKGDFDNAIALRQATASIANSKGDRTGLELRLFDMVPLAEYRSGKSSHIASIRKIMLGAIFSDVSIECLAPTQYKKFIEDYKVDYNFESITSVPIEGIVSTHEEALILARPIWNRGFEGLMLNTVNGYYDITKDRTRDLLKLKHVEEHTLKVIDVEIGKPGTKNANRLGALVVEYEGERVGVGSGLTDQQRDDWWANKDSIIGMYVEIETFGESTNAAGGKSLNCPIFKRVVGEE